MSITKENYLFITIACVVALIWILLPEINSANSSCYNRLTGNLLSYRLFNKIQFYYFLLGNFILLMLRKRLSVAQFLLIELLLIIPVLIKQIVYICSYE